MEVDVCVGPSASAPKLSSDNVSPGDQITVSGHCAVAHALIDIYLFSDPVHLGSTTANSEGDYSATVTIPLNVPAGAHHIGVAAAGSAPSLAAAAETALTVAAPARTSALVRTGRDLLRLFLAGSFLLLCGAALRTTQRRRSPR